VVGRGGGFTLGTVEFVETDVAEGVETFHHRPFGREGRQLWWPTLPAAPVLVLGSTQPETTIDHARRADRGIHLVRRRSGGGAVLVGADEVYWFDLVIDRDDPLWRDDIGEASGWVGQVLQRALADLGTSGTVHSGRLVRTEWSDRICFAGIGPGEVITDAGTKVAGVSQRRTRDAARFQCAVLKRWNAEVMVDLLDLGDDDRKRAAQQLRSAATGIEVADAAFRSAIAAALPR